MGYLSKVPYVYLRPCYIHHTLQLSMTHLCTSPYISLSLQNFRSFDPSIICWDWLLPCTKQTIPRCNHPPHTYITVWSKGLEYIHTLSCEQQYTRRHLYSHPSEQLHLSCSFPTKPTSPAAFHPPLTPFSPQCSSVKHLQTLHIFHTYLNRCVVFLLIIYMSTYKI